LEPENARVLFALVRQEGMANTSVVLSGETPAVSAPAVARRAPRYDSDYETVGASRRGTPRDERPIYWGQTQARTRGYVYDDSPYYRRTPQPSPFYMGPRF
jgi:hypothetical protein